MQQHFTSLTPESRIAVSFLTLLLNIEADGSPEDFLPWDVIDDLYFFLRRISYIAFPDGTEIQMPNGDLKTQIKHAQSIEFPFRLFIMAPHYVTSIGNDFFAACNLLTFFDTSGLRGVTSIGYGFLSACSNLITIDTSGLTSVVVIGNDFLYGCKSLISLDTSHFASVTTIGNFFLCDCSSLESFNMSGLSQAKSKGLGFLIGCRKLPKLFHL
eukprot:PhF_6_TR16949/c1_g1_i6/m.25560